eukprot:7555021-Alexandrium_andersonii.AAC.1
MPRGSQTSAGSTTIRSTKARGQRRSQGRGQHAGAAQGSGWRRRAGAPAAAGCKVATCRGAAAALQEGGSSPRSARGAAFAHEVQA